MKISIVTAAWQRHDLFKFFCEYWNNITPEIHLDLYCAVSEKETERIAKQNNFRTIFVSNEPLAVKWNTICSYASLRNPDYCIFIGSDDIINRSLMNKYIGEMKKGTDYISCLDWYFINTADKQLIYWRGYQEQYRKGHPCGAGRALSKNILKKINYQPWAYPGYDHILDTGFDKKLSQLTFSKKSFMMEGDEMGLDIKTSVNMTPYKQWNNTKQEHFIKLEKSFGKETTQKIFSLKY